MSVSFACDGVGMGVEHPLTGMLAGMKLLKVGMNLSKHRKNITIMLLL